MAKSESQGLQIALIATLLPLFVFIFTTYWFFRKYSESDAMSKKDKEALTAKDGDFRKTLSELQELKKRTGFPDTILQEDWAKASGEDLKRYAPTLPAENQTYKAALEQLSNALRETTTNLAATAADLQAQQLINEQREAATEAQIAAHKAKLDEAAKTYAQEQSTFISDRQRLEKAKADQVTINSDAEAKFTEERTALNAKVASYESQLSMLRAQMGQQQETIAQLEGETQAVPDGSVRRVNQRGTVWIDVGEADHLPRQLSFSVYGVDQNGVARGNRKGAIEVTRILDAHLAEAKILEDDILDPIVRGDLIYTPLWEPGRQERFALAGFMDLDGDDLSDRPIIRDMITMSGAVIDAELGDDGKLQGELSMETRYLIVGQRDREADPAGPKVGQLLTKAKELGVEVVPLAKFLEQSGWKDTKRVLRYGVTEPLDFKGPRVDGGQRISSGVVSGAFQKRGPRRQIGSAYGAKPVAKPAATPPPAKAASAGSADESPADERPASGDPTEEMPADEAPADAPVDEAPADTEPAADATEEAPAEGAPTPDPFDEPATP